MYKFFKTGALCAALLLTAADAGAARRKPSKLSAGNIDEIVAAMTPEEKANLIVGMSRSFSEAERADVGYTERIVAGAAGTTYPVERLGITPSCSPTDRPASASTRGGRATKRPISAREFRSERSWRLRGTTNSSPMSEP